MTRPEDVDAERSVQPDVKVLRAQRCRHSVGKSTGGGKHSKTRTVPVVGRVSFSLVKASVPPVPSVIGQSPGVGAARVISHLGNNSHPTHIGGNSLAIPLGLGLGLVVRYA